MQSAAKPEQPEAPQAPAQPKPVSPIADPAGYVALQFGPSFKVDPKFPPLFGDFDGDGDQDVVLFATSPTPLLSQEQFNFRVEDPYNGYFGEGNAQITSQFDVHIDGSQRDILIAFGWRHPPSEHKSKRVSKYVLINTPMERVSMTSFRLKKKDLQAIEAVDRTGVHSILFWDGKRWHWSAAGMDSGDLLPDEN
jgi:hypothetical protein